MSQSRALFLSTLMLAPTAALFGCHPDVQVQDSGSATDDNDIFDSEGADVVSDGEDTPTTSAGDPTDGPVNPVDYCELHPDESFPGMAFACSGQFSTGVGFDYYGDPEIPLNTIVPCFDFSDILPKEKGYVYSCVANISGEEFGPETSYANGKHVDACCLRDSPDEAVDAYCRIDAAQDLCVASSDGLNELRKQIPFIPKFKEINEQLLNLNDFLATSETQSDCASNFAKGLVAEGDFDTVGDSVSWSPESGMALDPEEGWPWFREIHMGINKFVLEEAAPTGLSCGEADLVGVLVGVLGGDIEGGTVEFGGSVGAATVKISRGTFAVRPLSCSLDACPFELASMSLGLEDFELGFLSFRDVEAVLSAPAMGTKAESAITMAGQEIKVAATFRVAMNGTPLFDDAALTVDLRAHDLAAATLTSQGLFSIERIEVVSWPIEMRLTTDPSQGRLIDGPVRP